ncbi:MAG: hypothetical protein ACM359_05105 [Bacillota bacterium]
MSEVQPPPPDSRPPYKLDYATPEPSPSGLAFLGQVVLGFVAFWAAGFVSATLGVSAGPLIGLGTMVVLLVLMGVMAVQCLNWSGFVAGQFLALGLALLAIGICASMFSRL